jgi:hypothetical protein
LAWISIIQRYCDLTSEESSCQHSAGLGVGTKYSALKENFFSGGVIDLTKVSGGNVVAYITQLDTSA